MSQAEAFLDGGEGRAWLERNRARLPIPNDPVQSLIKGLNIQPTSVLEIGCANGWRLEAMREQYQCKIVGIDPGAPPSLKDRPRWLLRGTATDVSFEDTFDCVIFGFCLYLVDRQDLFEIVARGDRSLKDQGYLVVYDFHVGITDAPKTVPYHHKDGLFSFKMNYENLWLANPTYRWVANKVYGEGDDAVSVSVLKKDLSVWRP